MTPLSGKNTEQLLVLTVATLLDSNNRMVLDNALGICEYLGAAFFFFHQQQGKSIVYPICSDDAIIDDDDDTYNN